MSGDLGHILDLIDKVKNKSFPASGSRNDRGAEFMFRAEELSEISQTLHDLESEQPESQQ